VDPLQVEVKDYTLHAKRCAIYNNEEILEEDKMALIRAFSRVDKEGKIQVPGNIQRAAGLKEGQLVELKIVGASRKKSILLTSRESIR
jgi:hypothetical protein